MHVNIGMSKRDSAVGVFESGVRSYGFKATLGDQTSCGQL